MRVKHNGVISEPRHRPGYGAQGASLGNQEFISQTNENSKSVPTVKRFKYMQMISQLQRPTQYNILSVGLSSYNIKYDVPSDIPNDGYFLPNYKSEFYRNEINKWSVNQKTLINRKNIKALIFNFTHKYKFSTQLRNNNINIDDVREMIQ